MINLLLRDLTGAQCLKHSFLGIAHLIFCRTFAPSLKRCAIRQNPNLCVTLCVTENRAGITVDVSPIIDMTEGIIKRCSRG